MISQCKSLIRRLRDPVLQEAKEAETAGEFSKAFQLYRKAIRIDPPHREGYAGVNRIKGILHERAKSIYTEAILAENFSDFANAKKLFQECLQIAPNDDIYYERAQRKLAHYFKKDEGAPAQ
jgi:tetratricopeptide (TPR) repeat protein